MKINCIIFGLTGLDTSPIVRSMKSHPDFNNVIWYGVFEGNDININEAYKYDTDYDYTLSLPETYLNTMQEALGDFLISSSRRSEAQFNSKDYILNFNSNYEYFHQFARYCYLIYKLITENDINLIIIDTFPHTSIDILLNQAANYFNIKILFLYQANIPNRFFYFTELKNKKPDFSLYYCDEARPVKNEESDYKINEPKQPFYMVDYSHLFYDEKKFFEDIKSVHRLEGLGKVEVNSSVANSKKKFLVRWAKFLLNCIMPNLFAKQQSKLIEKPIDSIKLFSEYLTKNFYDLPKAEAATSALLKSIKYRTYIETLNAISHREVDMQVPYVYFPLNFQPELTTECLGGFYKDIISAIEKIRVLIPKDWSIYVKEHWPQFEFARDPVFFKRMQSIPNLVMIDRYFSSLDLIKSSQFVATVNGTVGWEALHLEKNAVIFGTIYYQGLPGAFLYSPDLKLEDILQFKIDKATLEHSINKLINRMEYGVVSSDLSAFVENFDALENAKLVRDFIRNFFYKSVKEIHHQENLIYEA
ncbi:TPA: capsule biosynthesis protein [Legionella pneumophila]|uniref:capsular polysaccharide export protein, LipB/KpsS family n=1 Tax=Legionella pneumophila TaxID=446 RepID=UPI001A226D6C|nr:capsule biosynthesis protein [Legionella pneumophila]HAT1858390.1 capsule biosynthesis protein [Legionella pneumophila]HAT1871966.1 capsule biosynthesis protein [Legionella pneumophila]HAU1081695.1 capsule biosynthesis protein [Legionella pneumophila]HAU1116294.1 capsule biosynthesis protein [Legionella pneumophila]